MIDRQKALFAALAVLLAVGVGWYLFSLPSSSGGGNDGDSQRVEERLRDAKEQQREAASSLEQVKSSASRSAASAGRIEQSISRSERIANDIGKRNAEAKAGIDAATARNKDVAGRIDEAAAGIGESLELNRSSQQILARYAGQLQEGAKEARQNGKGAKE